MKKTTKAIRKELKQETENRETKLAMQINEARKEAFVYGNTDNYNKCLGLPAKYMEAYNDTIEKAPVTTWTTLVLNEARVRTLSEYEKINLTEMVKTMDLDTLKVSELKSLCKSLGLPITGKKQELKNHIGQYIFSHSDRKNDSDENVFSNIYNNGYLENISKLIVRKCGKSNTTIADTCNNIVFGGYNDALFEDIKQSIAECLFTMVKNGLAVWENGGFIYREILKDEKGSITGYGEFITDVSTKKQTTFLNLFVAVRKCIESYSKDSGHFENDIPENNGFESVDLLSALEDKESVVNFMAYLKKEDTKNYPMYCAIVQGIFEDRKQSEIADDYGVNVRKIKYLTSKLYDYAKSYFQCSGIVSIHNVDYVKMKAGGTTILKKDGGVYKESLTGKVIDITDTDKYHNTEKKGVILYNVKYRIC